MEEIQKTLIDLPRDCLDIIVNKLNKNELQILRCVSSKFKNAIKHEPIDLTVSMPLAILKNIFNLKSIKLTEVSINILKSIVNNYLIKVFNKIIQSENLENIKWLRSEECPWDEYTFTFAAYNGNLENMKWLFNKRCPWDEYTFSSAAYKGNLEIMKWLKNKGFPWNVNTFNEALSNENLQNIKWLRSERCPWNEGTFMYVAENVNFELINWLCEQQM